MLFVLRTPSVSRGGYQARPHRGEPIRKRASRLAPNVFVVRLGEERVVRHSRVVRDEHAVLGGEVAGVQGRESPPHPRVRAGGQRSAPEVADAARDGKTPKRVGQLVRLERVGVPLQRREQRRQGGIGIGIGIGFLIK